jgi:hypothetical protein
MEANMTTIKATIRNGRIEVDEPIDLPDGTELTIPLPVLPAPLGKRDEDWSDTPEAIEAWIRWYDALEPCRQNVPPGKPPAANRSNTNWRNGKTAPSNWKSIFNETLLAGQQCGR